MDVANTPPGPAFRWPQSTNTLERWCFVRNFHAITCNLHSTPHAYLVFRPKKPVDISLKWYTAYQLPLPCDEFSDYFQTLLDVGF